MTDEIEEQKHEEDRAVNMKGVQVVDNGNDHGLLIGAMVVLMAAFGLYLWHPFHWHPATKSTPPVQINPNQLVSFEACKNLPVLQISNAGGQTARFKWNAKQNSWDIEHFNIVTELPCK